MGGARGEDRELGQERGVGVGAVGSAASEVAYAAKLARNLKIAGAVGWLVLSFEGGYAIGGALDKISGFSDWAASTAPTKTDPTEYPWHYIERNIVANEPIPISAINRLVEMGMPWPIPVKQLPLSLQKKLHDRQLKEWDKRIREKRVNEFDEVTFDVPDEGIIIRRDIHLLQ